MEYHLLSLCRNDNQGLFLPRNLFKRLECLIHLYNHAIPKYKIVNGRYFAVQNMIIHCPLFWTIILTVILGNLYFLRLWIYLCLQCNLGYTGRATISHWVLADSRRRAVRTETEWQLWRQAGRQANDLVDRRWIIQGNMQFGWLTSKTIAGIKISPYVGKRKGRELGDG